MKKEARDKFDLEERTARFGETVIGICRQVPVTAVTSSLIDQLVRAATSVGANYCEADDATSKKDFRHRICICLREIKESKHWVRMMAAAVPEVREAARALWQEAKELNLIFAAIRRSTGPRV